MIRQLTVFFAFGLVSMAGWCQAEKATLEAVCSDQLVSLDRISETRRLIEENQQHPVAQCDKYKSSLADLQGILDVIETGHICNLDLVKKIRHYHMKFIDTSLKSNPEERENAPKSLKQFFISLCFQISAECKMGLINNLEYDTKNVINEQDYEQIKLLEKYGATLLDDDTEIRDFDDILLLNDLNEAAGIEQGSEETKVVVKVKTNNALRQLMDVCKRKFKPFYDKLIMPLIKLSNLGYNYQGEMLERELEELKQSPLIKRWYNIVQTCEAFGMIKIFEDPDMVVDDSTDEARQMITFISEDEASVLKRRHLQSLDEQVSANRDSEEEEFLAHYWPPASHNVDELWIKDQKELEKQVKRYKTSATEIDRVQAKLMRKMVAKIKEFLKSGKVIMLMSELIKCNRQNSCESDKMNVNEDMIMMMDDAVEMEELEKGTAVVPLDKPVAGGKAVRSMVSRAGPVYRSVSNDKVPAKVDYFPRYRDGTKFSTKVGNWSNKIFPTKMTMLMWIIGILGLLLLVMGIVMHG